MRAVLRRLVVKLTPPRPWLRRFGEPVSLGETAKDKATCPLTFGPAWEASNAIPKADPLHSILARLEFNNPIFGSPSHLDPAKLTRVSQSQRVGTRCASSLYTVPIRAMRNQPFPTPMYTS